MAKQASKKMVLIIFLVLILAGAGGVYLFFAERNLPQLNISPNKGPIGKNSPLKLKIRDKDSGLSFLHVQAKQDSDQVTILKKDFPNKIHSREYSFNLSDTPFRDGRLEFFITVRDYSWAHLFQGNEKAKRITYKLDTHPPVISPKSFQHNLTQGGSGLVKYSLSESIEKTGLKFGQFFFPAYRQKDHSYLCLFSFPYNEEKDKAQPKLIAVDRAGNQGEGHIHYYLKDKKFPESSIRITNRFLQRKMPQFFRNFPQYKRAGIEIFLKVNNELRDKNRARLQEISLNTSCSKVLWEGRFLRQPGARESGFGDWRTYVYQGREVDHQRHLGVDIASTARAPVKASNSGNVVYSKWLGIYGKTVIIDHGLGLQTLYGHLSQIGVEQGQEVEKGQVIGRTGTTGLAGGDHLHFAVLISGRPVNPIEWWDSHWIENNILNKIHTQLD